MERRRRITGDLTLMGDEALRASDPDVDADNVADHGSDAYERNLTLGLMEHDARTLQQIDLALAAMSQGVYGLCSDCDAPIPLARLEALPFATTCVPCQEKNEGLF
ncbi:MAG: TraR/DksA family transcriptional regulator [Planctomycetes bacterium]|nr:TraR/DksA family transcriptional regulator [Planctomycetota bacterium]